jgi:hypothetical protein
MMKIEKFTARKKCTMKDVQVRGETQQRTSSDAKHEIFTFLILRVIFALLDPDTAAQNQCGSMRIRIHNTVNEVRLLGTYNTCARCCTLQKLQKYSGAHKLWFRV